MATGSLPFQVQKGHSHQGQVTSCPLFKLLPAALQEESKNHEFLLDYIHMLPVDEVGIPEYYAELNRDMGDLKDPNLIYPVGDEVYIHIFLDKSDSRDYYIAIQPGMTQKMDGLMEGLEDRLVDYVDELDDLDGAQTDRGKVLRDILAKACVVVTPKDLRAQRGKNGKKAAARLRVSRAEMDSLRYQLVRDKEGMGVMEPLFLDPYLEDISCSGLGSMYLEHKIFKSLKTNISFGSMEELDTFVIVFLHPNSKIVSIEDTPELQVPHPNWIREVIRGKAGDDSSSVTMFDLLRAALRQRPNEIIIGEIRGEEGAIAFQAMQTGHACMATFHAATVEKLIQRLTGHPINIPKTYIDNLNLAVIQSLVRLPNGKDGRRIISVNEIVSYDSATDSSSYIEVFRWNPADDTYEFTGYMNSYLLEEVIAFKLASALVAAHRWLLVSPRLLVSPLWPR